MNFELDDSRRMLAASLDRYVAERYGFAERERNAQGDEGFSHAHWVKLVEIGALGALFPEEMGGFAGTGFDVTLVFECLGKGLVVEPFLGSLMVGRAIGHAASAAFRGLLIELVEGHTLAALAHEEPGTHHDTHHVRTFAKPLDDGWELTGSKAVVHNGEQADILLVSARVVDQDAGADGISLFLVPAGAKGLSWRGYRKIDGGRAAELQMDGVRVRREDLLASAGQGAQVLEHALGWGLLALSAESLGAMEVVKRDTLEYLRTRKQFGVHIGSFQALQHRMADLLLQIEQARSAVINAAAVVGGSDRLAREKALSAAKYSIGRVGTRVAEESIQLHGGIGMTWELPLSHYAKRLLMIDHQLGDEDHHLARYIALAQCEVA